MSNERALEKVRSVNEGGEVVAVLAGCTTGRSSYDSPPTAPPKTGEFNSGRDRTTKELTALEAEKSKHKISYQHRWIRAPMFWPRRKYQDGHGRMTIAVERVADDRWLAAVAWCSPTDQFSRARGRAIAGGAIRHNRDRAFPVHLTPEANEAPGALLQRVFQRVVERVWAGGIVGAYIPNWAPTAPPDPAWVPPGVKPRGMKVA